MEFGLSFLSLFILLITGLIGGIVAIRLRQPLILGELVAGILIGLLGFYIPKFEIIETTSLNFLAEIGICALLFNVGLEINLPRIRTIGTIAVTVAVVGVILPFLMGYIVSSGFGLSHTTSLVIGASLTATSVGITAEVLEELNESSSDIGNIVVSAAVLDDILGLFILTIVTGITTQGQTVSSILRVIFITVFFFGVSFVFFRPLACDLLDWIEKKFQKKHVLIASFGFLSLFAYVAQKIGLDLIVGAFIAGFVLSKAKEKEEIYEAFQPIVNLFAGLFFVIMGTRMSLSILKNLSVYDLRLVYLVLLLLVSAVLGKLVSGVAVPGDARKKLIVGSGMIPRGEVGLIYANIGLSMGMLQRQYFSVILGVIILTSFLGPLLIKLFYQRNKS